METIDRFMQTHFPWVVQHPTALVVTLALYSVYSILVNNDNAIKAEVINNNANPAALYKIQEKLYIYGLPIAVFAISSIFAYRANVGFRVWLYAALFATVSMFFALASAYKIESVGNSKRIAVFAIFIAAVSIVNSYIYGQWTAVGFEICASAVCGGVIYVVMPLIRLIRQFVASNSTLFLGISTVYSILVISTFLYALAALLWDELQILSK